MCVRFRTRYGFRLFVCVVRVSMVPARIALGHISGTMSEHLKSKKKASCRFNYESQR